MPDSHEAADAGPPSEELREMRSTPSPPVATDTGADA